ncbi:hypothetical protein F2Q68_00028319 [Brassica cretica]|uniref:Neprosin PEP catalytic domain-containing protein n=1 Tax=Brassica cretica TaxID=69181 RepID=A0A8S9IEE2_BRACR|nr:hypothetical protein F2Q68_00028319 [Brassica cretica]
MDFPQILRFILVLAIIKVAVTIKTSDGDDVECIDKIKQPAFESTLLKNHKIQEWPSEIPRTVEADKKSKLETWEAQVSTVNCPEGTVPVRNYSVSKTDRTGPDFTSYNRGHEYAIISQKSPPELYGAKATINVWDPAIEGKEMSISQIWISSGKYKTDDLNTLEVGWQVLPTLYGDNKPRLFIFWTVSFFISFIAFYSDSYKNGCYNLRCSGFIQTSSSIVLGGAISPTSSFGGSQYEITILVWKDRIYGNWWLSLGPSNLLVGYWPKELFTTLADYATIAEWGGEILNLQNFSRHTKTQMGSGHFPKEGFGKSSYFRNLKFIDNNNSLQPIQNIKKIVTNPESYNVKTEYTDEWKSHFFYGGPGFRSTQSRAVPLAFSSCFVIYCLALFMV